MKITLYPKYLILSIFAKGRDSFFSAGYKLLYPECSTEGMTPWQHYLIYGKRKGFDNGNNPPDIKFFPEGYEFEYPDVNESKEDPWRHYAENGHSEGRDNGLHPGAGEFFAEGYLAMYPDVKKAGADPWHHYVLHGKKEGRDNGLHPGAGEFFAEGYLAMYPDVKKAGADPWHHYVLHGKKEGRDNGLHPGAGEFFAEGYLAMYPDVKKAGADPWHHYVLHGKKEGRDNGLHPGLLDFFAEGYLEMYPDVKKAGLNPWRHYVLQGKQDGRDNGQFIRCCEASDERIADYWNNHNNRKKVMYSCITGAYDRLINHHYISDDYDYVCFTDNPELLKLRVYGVWRIRPLVFNKLDNIRNSRWHKTHPHELFHEYEESIWIDSNINVLTDYIFTLINNTKKDFLTPKHFKNDCIYEELKYIVKCHKDTKHNMQVLHDLYTNEEMPHKLGAPETNLLYRRHKNKNIIKIMNMWWNMIEKYSSRDQASFMYVIWKNHINPDAIFIPNLRIDFKNFAFSAHNKCLNGVAKPLTGEPSS